MQDKKNQTLVLVSVPFWRVGKVLVSNTFLSSLDDERLTIGLVGPLKFEKEIASIKNKNNILCYNWKPKFSKALFSLYNISEVMRMNGFWFRYRNTKMKYYYYNMFVNFSEDGNDKKKSFHVRMFLFILSWIGSIKYSWKIIDDFISAKYDYPKEFESLSNQYKKIVLIQSCTWGEQDRILASWAKRNKIDSYFIPYTTDQLIMNGYLLNEYKKIFLQGTIEYEYATKVHRVSIASIYKAGSLWLRNLDAYITNKDIKSNETLSRKKVLYAGVLPLYYPRKLEITIIKALFSELRCKEDVIHFIYRPYISSNADKQSIIESLSDCKDLEIQWPDAQINEVTNETMTTNLSASIVKEINRLTEIDLFIVSVSTSMCIEAAYLSNCAVISNMIDFSGMLRKRFTQQSFVEKDTLKYVPGVDLAFTIEELINKSKSVLRGSRKEDFSPKKIVSSWDYNNDQFPACIKSFILNNN